MDGNQARLSTAPEIPPVGMTPYQHRPVRFVELWRPVGNWRLKIYGINVDQTRNTAPTILDAGLLERAKETVATTLRRTEFGSDAVHEAGYVIIHQGVLGTWLLLDWWSHHILWNQLLFRSNSLTSPEFLPVTNGIIACVWEVPVISFERDAWVRLVLQAGAGVARHAALSAYFETRYNGDI